MFSRARNVFTLLLYAKNTMRTFRAFDQLDVDAKI